jgi:hypothetical protein
MLRARRTQFGLFAIGALAIIAGLAGFFLRAPLERAYELAALRKATGWELDARRIERTSDGYVLSDLVAWTHGGGFYVDAPLARFVAADEGGEAAIAFEQPRFVVSPGRLRGDERSRLPATTMLFAHGMVTITAGSVPEPAFTFEQLSGTVAYGDAFLRYDVRAALRASGRLYPVTARTAEETGVGVTAEYSAPELPLAALAGLLSPQAPLRPTGGQVRDIHIAAAGARVHATARLEAVSASFGAHALASVHGRIVFDNGGIGSRELAGSLDGVPFSAAGEVHDLGQDGSWLRYGSPDLRALEKLLAAMANTPRLSAVRLEATAPGIGFGQYGFATPHGPVAVSLLALNPSEPTLHFDTAIAQDRVISGGERTSALGLRTGAVAGVNGDYFDIGRTYQPQGMLVRSGVLVRGPTDRAALVIDRSNHVTFGEFHLRGEVRTARGTMTITELNDSPPGDVSVITPAFGAVLPAAPGCTFIALEPLRSAAGRYRVTDVAPMTGPLPVRFGIAVGPLVHTPLPSRGETLEVRYDLDPHVPNALAGIGGGPILLRGGKWYEDAHAPAPAERDVRWPVIALATEPDGGLLLVALDGRHPERSVGATRPEFGALLQRLGAVDAMALDSGGSVTLIDRAVGDANVSVRNVPSDFSAERWISDALFVYSSAPPPSLVPIVAAPTPVPEARPTP